MYIFKAVKVDNRYIPPKETIIEFPTEKETIEWLEANDGGIYRNILHGFDCTVKAFP